jgi:hypothetical protein
MSLTGLEVRTGDQAHLYTLNVRAIAHITSLSRANILVASLNASASAYAPQLAPAQALEALLATGT